MTKDEEIEYLKEKVNLYRFDSLTGLKGRRDFEFDVQKKIKEDDFYLCYFDVDHLHKTNREKGFSEGDALIRGVVDSMLRQSIPHVSYRYSGDEFYSICYDEYMEDVDNATMVCVHVKQNSSLRGVMKVLDELMIEKKNKNRTRRADD